MPRCAGNTEDGRPCERIVTAAQRYCYSHDPARSEERRRNASRAGRSKPDTEPRGLKSQLQSLADRVLSGDLGRADAAVVSQVLNVKLRALELERKWKELGEMQDRLEALEDVLRTRRTG
jgi:hypothetical protein